MDEKELQEILAISRENNASAHITGMLLYVEGEFLTHKEARFIQILEGSKAAVLQVFGKIEQDERHHQVVKLQEGKIQQRTFAGWEMGYESINLSEHPDLFGFFTFDNEILLSEDFKESNAVLDFMKSFYYENNKG